MCGNCNQGVKRNYTEKNNVDIMTNATKIEILREISEAKFIDTGSGTRDQLFKMFKLYNSYFDDNITNFDNSNTIRHIWNHMIVLRQKIKNGELSLVEPVKVEKKSIENEKIEGVDVQSNDIIEQKVETSSTTEQFKLEDIPANNPVEYLKSIKKNKKNKQ